MKRKKFYNLNTQMDFGKYAGYQVTDVIAEDFQYLIWCLETVYWFLPGPELLEIFKESPKQIISTSN